jgi:hypothetical protein
VSVVDTSTRKAVPVSWDQTDRRGEIFFFATRPGITYAVTPVPPTSRVGETFKSDNEVHVAPGDDLIACANATRCMLQPGVHRSALLDGSWSSLVGEPGDV